MAYKGQQYSSPQAPYSIPPRQSLQRRRGLSAGMTILLIVLALLIIGGSGLILYTTVIQPKRIHAQATSTAGAKVTETVHTNATGTAQAAATVQAVANVTTTVQAQATIKASATATALEAIYTQAISGAPVLDDALSHQDLNQWEEDNKAGGGG